MDKTILYLTDSKLDDRLAQRCREVLWKAADGLPIISISQKPLDFGRNICVGPMARRWVSLFKVQVLGLNEIKTPVMAFAEHDVLYSKEHFAFDPPELDVFYYNRNCWLGQWSDTNHPELKGMYSYWNKYRCAQSQLITGTEIALKAYTQRLELIKRGIISRAVPAEPGYNKEKALRDLVRYNEKTLVGENIPKILGEWVGQWKMDYFQTKIPNVDIRHGKNMSGQKRGIWRRYELPYWGRLESVLN